MRDEMLELRLREALRSEGDELGLTITAAELERRLAARRRGRTTRGFGLFLAAALSVGALGAAAVAGGLFNPHGPSPAPSQQAQVPPSGAPKPSAPIASANPIGPGVGPELPSLDDLIALPALGDVLIAQEHGPGFALGIDDTAGAVPSLLQFGPFEGYSTYEVTFGCVSKAGAGDLAGITIDPTATPATATEGTIPCDGTVTTREIDGSGSEMVRVATPRLSSWRFVVRGALEPSHVPIPQILHAPVAEPGQMTVVNATGDHRKPSPTVGPGTTTELGSLPFRPSYHAQASCVGASSMEYLIGTRDSATSVFADTTTVLPCDGTVHSADLSFGELNWHDVFVRADRKTDWHLLVTVEPPPIATARDETGWKLSTDAGPRYNFSDSTESLVGGAGEASATIRIVVTCLGGTDITVTVNSNSVATEPPLQSYTVPCNAAAPTTVTETVELPNGSYDVEIGPHGRMWYATTVQREIAASHAP